MKEAGAPKSNLAYAIIVTTWIACIVHFDPKLLKVLDRADPWIAWFTFIVFIGFINLFWLYGIYHLFFLIYRLLPKKPTATQSLSRFPKVAILYTTRNDFQVKSVLSCLRQSYPNFHLYILDDSTEPDYIAKIDEFHKTHHHRFTVVRREGRQGFKAGNLNNALRGYARSEEYFAVVDADEVVPEDFVAKLLPCFDLDESIAFVQAYHEHNPEQPSPFAQDLAAGIDFHWDVYQPPRNRHGFVIFYGHGAVIRRDVWEQVGGFPEIVSEDLAFSTRIRQMGYRGYFARDVICREDFPETYLQFRKRQEKWVQGACEYLHHEFLAFMLSKGATLAEKFDVLLSLLALFMPALFLLYLIVANALLPLFLAEKHTLSFTLFGETFRLMPAYFLEPKFKKLWTFDFYLVTILGMFSPIFCYFCRIFTEPKRIGKLLLKSAVPYISLILVATCSILNYLLTRKAIFLTTGDRTAQCRDDGRSGALPFARQLSANHSAVFHCEWILGLILVYLSLMTMNFALLTISSCLLLSPAIARFGWENKVVSLLVYLPLMFVVLTFGGMGMGFLGIQGFSLYFLAFHF